MAGSYSISARVTCAGASKRAVNSARASARGSVAPASLIRGSARMDGNVSMKARPRPITPRPSGDAVCSTASDINRDLLTRRARYANHDKPASLALAEHKIAVIRLPVQQHRLAGAADPAFAGRAMIISGFAQGFEDCLILRYPQAPVRFLQNHRKFAIIGAPHLDRTEVFKMDLCRRPVAGHIANILHHHLRAATIDMRRTRRFQMRPEVVDPLRIAAIMMQGDVRCERGGLQLLRENRLLAGAGAVDEPEILLPVRPQLVAHGKDRRNADPAGDKEIFIRRNQLEIILGRQYFKHPANGGFFDHAARGAPPVAIRA